MAEFVARFYDINKCGYYPYPADADPVLGGFDFLLGELKRWSAGKTLEQTRLPVPTNALPAYLLGIDSRAGCYVIVLWNEVPSSEGAIASVSRNSPVGNPTLHENPIAANSIPGFPTYFLCLPEHGLVATLKYGDRITGLPSFKNYLSVFQQVGTSIVVLNEDQVDPADNEIIGYMNDEGEVLNLHPRFQLQVRRSGTQRAAILAASARIRKVVRVKEMDPTNRADLQMYQKGLAWLGLGARRPLEAVRFSQEIEIRPTREEVAAMIDEVEDEVEARVNDVGFLMQGSGTPLWLSGSMPSQIIDIEARAEDGVFSATNMAILLNYRKAAVLAAARQ